MLEGKPNAEKCCRYASKWRQNRADIISNASTTLTQPFQILMTHFIFLPPPDDTVSSASNRVVRLDSRAL
jgi:hypothetical protein